MSYLPMCSTVLNLLIAVCTSPTGKSTGRNVQQEVQTKAMEETKKEIKKHKSVIQHAVNYKENLPNMLGWLTLGLGTITAIFWYSGVFERRGGPMMFVLFIGGFFVYLYSCLLIEDYKNSKRAKSSIQALELVLKEFDEKTSNLPEWTDPNTPHPPPCPGNLSEAIMAIRPGVDGADVPDGTDVPDPTAKLDGADVLPFEKVYDMLLRTPSEKGDFH